MPPTKERKGVLLLSVFDGSRKRVPSGKQLRFRLHDGSRKKRHDKSQKKSRLKISLPFADNRDDDYAVVVTGRGYEQTGFHPVKLKEGVVTRTDLMVLSKRADLRLRDALWRNLSTSHPSWTRFLQGDLESDAAGQRHDDWLDDKPEHLAAFLNFAEALSDLPLRIGTAFSYFKQPFQGDLAADFEQDRCFAFADSKLVEQVEDALAQDVFAKADASLHPGATRSFKEIRFGAANVQITLHENDRRRIGRTNCIKVEVDIDYYRDTAAHGVLEVIPNAFGGITDPRKVYRLRWMAGRQAGLPEFNPPYTIA